MKRRGSAAGTVLAVLLVLATGCGASPPEPAACEGVSAGGACWVAGPGISISPERAQRLMDVAVALWKPDAPFLPGWRIELVPDWVVVDGEKYGGYTWRGTRTIVVTSGCPDCFERSALLHEMGHAWGHDHDDVRMSSGWPWIREAMRHSRWAGCEFEEDDDDDREPAAAGLRTPP